MRSLFFLSLFLLCSAFAENVEDIQVSKYLNSGSSPHHVEEVDEGINKTTRATTCYGQQCGAATSSCCATSRDHCCLWDPKQAICCPDTCYPLEYKCCSDGGACPSGKTCCGDYCCSSGTLCNAYNVCELPGDSSADSGLATGAILFIVFVFILLPIIVIIGIVTCIVCLCCRQSSPPPPTAYVPLREIPVHQQQVQYTPQPQYPVTQPQFTVQQQQQQQYPQQPYSPQQPYPQASQQQQQYPPVQQQQQQQYPPPTQQQNPYAPTHPSAGYPPSASGFPQYPQ